MDNYMLDYEYRAQQFQEQAEHKRLLKQLPGRKSLFDTMRKTVKDLLRSQE